MNNNTAANAEHRVKAIEGQIRNLALDLSKLAAHPDAPARGAAFISLSSEFMPAANYDGMLGSIMLEGFLSEAFDGASNDNSQIASAIDFAQEYLEERGSDSHNNHGRGRGSLARYERKLSPPFNAFQSAEMDAYMGDMDERLDIEETISGLLKEREHALHQYALAC